MNNNKFVYDFKKWLKAQNEINENKKLIGNSVTTNLSLKHFCEVADIIIGNSLKIGKDFIKNGGTVEEIIENQVLIKSARGRFYLNINDIIEN
jgi:hypothetical protein